MRTLKSGNEYVLIKPYTTEDGKTIDTGQICQYRDGYLMTYDSTSKYVKFKAELVPDDDLLLYDETPYNREYRKRRERIATAAMQALITGGMTSSNSEKYLSVEWWKGEGVAKCAVTFADALIEELKKQGD